MYSYATIEEGEIADFMSLQSIQDLFIPFIPDYVQRHIQEYMVRKGSADEYIEIAEENEQFSQDLLLIPDSCPQEFSQHSNGTYNPNMSSQTTHVNEEEKLTGFGQSQNPDFYGITQMKSQNTVPNHVSDKVFIAENSFDFNSYYPLNHGKHIESHISEHTTQSIIRCTQLATEINYPYLSELTEYETDLLGIITTIPIESSITSKSNSTVPFLSFHLGDHTATMFPISLWRDKMKFRNMLDIGDLIICTNINVKKYKDKLSGNSTSHTQIYRIHRLCHDENSQIFTDAISGLTSKRLCELITWGQQQSFIRMRNTQSQVN
jgi:hypothetical protein